MGTRSIADADGVLAQIEALLVELASRIEPAPVAGPGRPRLLPAAVLWASLTIGVLRGAMSQAAVWRLVTDRGLWREQRVWVTDEAVYKRLGTEDPSPLATLFAELTPLLQARIEPAQQRHLAPFAADVVVLDESTLDPVARSLCDLRDLPAGDKRLLPGKLAGVFDVRRQLWRTLIPIEAPCQNEKVAARTLVTALRPGTLILADLGYFSFAWFDELTDAGHYWISRARAKTSMRVVHTFFDDETTFDGLVELGIHRADRAKHVVRLVRVRRGPTAWAYLTNVTDPTTLPLGEIITLYLRRWDIELAVKLVKRELGLHLLWSAKPQVILHQVWAVMLIAQILQAVRLEIASRAQVDIFDVSMNLLVRYLPQYAAQHDDPIAAFVAEGRLLGFIRPSRRLKPTVPIIPTSAITFPPPDLPLTRIPRYAGRKCGPDRADLRN